MNKIKNLLIHSPTWLGDIVMSMPAIYLIKEKYKDIKITVMTKKSMFGIFEVSDLVDDIIELKNFPSLRKYNFDTAILFPNSFESAFRIFGHGIKRRIGYKADYRNFLLTDAIDREEVRWIHTADYYINLLKAIDINAPRPKIKLKIKEEILIKAKEYLKEFNPENKKNICLRNRRYKQLWKNLERRIFCRNCKLSLKKIQRLNFIYNDSRRKKNTRKNLFYVKRKANNSIFQFGYDSRNFKFMFGIYWKRFGRYACRFDCRNSDSRFIFCNSFLSKFANRNK